MSCSLRSRINQQIKKQVFRGFIQNVTSGEFPGQGGLCITTHSVHLPAFPQFQNRIIVVGFGNLDKSPHSPIILVGTLDSAFRGRKARLHGRFVTGLMTKGGCRINPWLTSPCAWTTVISTLYFKPRKQHSHNSQGVKPAPKTSPGLPPWRRAPDPGSAASPSWPLSTPATSTPTCYLGIMQSGHRSLNQFKSLPPQERLSPK